MVEIVREGKGLNTLEEEQLVPYDVKTILVFCMIASNIDSPWQENRTI